MIINNKILDELTAKANVNPRLRMAMDLRNSPEDSSQRMLNALEPGTVMPIHRHHGSSETVVILRGKVRWMFYDENGVETESVLLDADGDVRCINVERDRWHSLTCLESGTVLLECKDGAYRPLAEDEVMVAQEMMDL
jgi:cupin fold WbuC family metalloprotein